MPRLKPNENYSLAADAVEQWVRRYGPSMLGYLSKLRHREIAEVLNCSLGTVKTHMSRALATLARTLPAPE